MDYVQDQGRACYKRGEYDKAIEHFDRAIGHNPSVQLLDNRAACYEKLGQLHKALKDAKSAIHQQREDPTGYLRAGKVLMKMEKPTVALEIYNHGLRSIKHVGKGYELLRKVHKEVLDQVSPPKSVDPMTVLPRELAIQILEYLSFKQRMNACLVSNQWARFIRTCPDLWKCLDLSQSRRFVRNAFISRAINTARKRLTSAILGKYTDLDKALPALSQHCRLEDLTLLDMDVLRLASLDRTLKYANQLKHLSINSPLSIISPAMTTLFEAGLHERLESLRCNVHNVGNVKPFLLQFPVLHTLELHTLRNPAFEEVVSRISDRMPILRSLTLRVSHDTTRSTLYSFDFGGCSSLQQLDLKIPLRSAAQITLPPSLAVLKLETTANPLPANFWFVEGNAGLEPHTFFLPKLEELDLEIPRMVVHNTLHMVTESYPEALASEPESVTMSKLRSLTIRGASLNYKQVNEVLNHARLSELQHLHLPRLGSCSDEDAIQMVDAAPHLQSLDLSETNITGIAVKRALRLKHLRELMVNNCPKIYHDAIQLARSHGVKVQHRMSDGANGGRKVRQ